MGGNVGGINSFSFGGKPEENKATGGSFMEKMKAKFDALSTFDQAAMADKQNTLNGALKGSIWHQ